MSARRSAFALALLAILGLYLAACLYANPVADDFIYASNARGGFARAWVQEYVGWNGRYASNALLLAIPLPLGVGAYRLAAALMIASIAGVVYVLLRGLGGETITRSDAAVCSAAYSVLFLSQTPSIGDSVYWFTSEQPIRRGPFLASCTWRSCSAVRMQNTVPFAGACRWRQSSSPLPPASTKWWR